MTPENFSAFLNSPEAKEISIDNLQKLIEKYPYVQSLRIAFLKKLKAENHPDFNKYVSQTAAYAYDRNFLRKYINGENIYVLEYVNNQVSAENLETLELMPLKLIDDGNLIEKEKLIIENSEAKTVINKAVIKAEKPISTDEKLIQSSEVIEEDLLVPETIDDGELLPEPVELKIEEQTPIDLENENNSVVDEIEVEDFQNEIAAVDIREVIEELPENEETLENINENIDEMQQAIIEKKSLDKDIQHLIIDSKKVEYYPPIEEDIDHLIKEDELEGLDDEIEFGFEIDKKIIADSEDISLFDSEEEEHKEGKHEEKHHSNHAKEEVLERVEHKKDENDEIVIDDFELSPDNIFSKDDLHQEGDLFFLDEKPTVEELQEVESFHDTTSRPTIDFVKESSNYENEDAEAFPEEFEEEEAKVESRENVEKIKAVLFEAETKATKKAKIKQYLQRIAQIPLEEESMISETYAGLLAKQGKIERSIRMYQQLILKNPQKKVYFAAKIKQLIKSI